MFPCILPYVVYCSAIVFLWVWGASGVCLAPCVCVCVCVVIGVLVHSAYVAIRGQLWVSGHRCLFETSFIDWNIMQTQQQFCWIPCLHLHPQLGIQRKPLQPAFRMVPKYLSSGCLQAQHSPALDLLFGSFWLLIAFELSVIDQVAYTAIDPCDQTDEVVIY